MAASMLCVLLPQTLQGVHLWPTPAPVSAVNLSNLLSHTHTTGCLFLPSKTRRYLLLLSSVFPALFLTFCPLLHPCASSSLPCFFSSPFRLPLLRACARQGSPPRAAQVYPQPRACEAPAQDCDLKG